MDLLRAYSDSGSESTASEAASCARADDGDSVTGTVASVGNEPRDVIAEIGAGPAGAPAPPADRLAHIYVALEPPDAWLAALRRFLDDMQRILGPSIALHRLGAAATGRSDASSSNASPGLHISLSRCDGAPTMRTDAACAWRGGA